MPIPQEISALHIFRAIQKIDAGTIIPPHRQSTEYDLIYKDRRYPPKFVISLANKEIPNRDELSPSEFSGGQESNDFLTKRGYKIIPKSQLSIFPLEYDSWRINGSMLFLKQLDKSAFVHSGTGIPMQIRDYFDIVDMQPGESRKITLTYNNQQFFARFTMEKKDSPRTRLFWHQDFDEVLRESLPHWYSLFSQDGEVESRPIMQMERNSSQLDDYFVQFIDPMDLGAENDEEKYQSCSGTQFSAIFEEYSPPKRPPTNTSQSRSIQPPRSCREGNITLLKAGFQCEVDSSHSTFITPEGLNYMEKHHLIPMEQYANYQKSIDHYSNIYSLCPTCHRRIHHGTSDDKRNMVVQLFEKRKENYCNEYAVELSVVLSHYGVE
jgi:5-methylcytosine-specific restriction protein A